ncbi:MAG: PAS domain S-box protein [Acidobacteriota bacterium]
MKEKGKSSPPAIFPPERLSRHFIFKPYYLPRWGKYVLAVALTAAALLLHVFLGFSPSEDLGLTLFLIPIVLSAYMGGLGTGLVSTAIIAIFTHYYLINLIHNLPVYQTIHRLEWVTLVAIGSLISFLIEALHRSRQKAEAMIAERDEMQISLCENESRLSAIFQGISDAAVFTDLERRIVLVNPAFTTMFGYTAEEALGRGTDFLYADLADFERMGRERFNPHAQSDPSPYQISFRRQDGSTFWTESLGLRIYAEDGTPKGYLGVHRDITERRRAKAELSYSEARYRALVLATSQIVWTADATGSVTTALNLEPYIDVTRNPQGMNWLKAVHPDERERVLQVYQAGIRNQLPFEVENRGVYGDGSYHDYLTRVVPVKNADGTVREWTAASTDITDRKRAEKDLRESEERFRQFAENIKDVLWINNPHIPKVLYVSPAYEKLWGRPAVELYADFSQWLAGIHPDDRQMALETFANGRGEGGYDTEYRVARPDGSLIWIRDRGFPIFNERGELIRMSGIAEDITERKHAETALQESEERFRVLFNEKAVASLIIDLRNHSIVDCNEKALELFGYSKVEMLQLGIPDLTVNETDENVNRIRDEILEIKMNVQIESSMRTQSGEVLNVLANGSTVQIGGGTFGYCSMIDITDRKRAEDALAKYTEELARSNKDLEQFAYVASHDLQEPLRAVAGCVQVLQRRYAGRLDDRADELIRHTVDGAERMRILIEDLLAFSRVGTRGGKFATCDSQKSLTDALANLRLAIAESGAQITHGALPLLTADATQLTLLFQNLLSNAIKFRRASAPQIHIEARHQANEWVFSVRDNGIGIEPQYHQRIFGIFQRLHTRHEYPGTGMGLAICKRIVERHSGRIWVESVFGEGGTFYFSLPDKKPIERNGNS